MDYLSFYYWLTQGVQVLFYILLFRPYVKYGFCPSMLWYLFLVITEEILSQNSIVPVIVSGLISCGLVLILFPKKNLATVFLIYDVYYIFTQILGNVLIALAAGGLMLLGVESAWTLFTFEELTLLTTVIKSLLYLIPSLLGYYIVHRLRASLEGLLEREKLFFVAALFPFLQGMYFLQKAHGWATTELLNGQLASLCITLGGLVPLILFTLFILSITMRRKRESQAAALQIEASRQHYQEISSLQQEVRYLWHDVANLLAAGGSGDELREGILKHCKMLREGLEGEHE